MPPDFAPNFDAFFTAMKAETDKFLADMQAQTAAAAAGFKLPDLPGPLVMGEPSDMDILAAIQQNPELRKAVAGLVVAARPKPAATPAPG